MPRSTPSRAPFAIHRRPICAALLTPAPNALIDWRRSSFAFLSSNGSIDFLTMKDQIDVGVSARLQSGFSLFDPLNAVSPGPALRSACLGTAKAGLNLKRLFHVPRLSRDGLGPLCTPAVHHSRRATFESPILTAYHFGPSLQQPRVACSW